MTLGFGLAVMSVCATLIAGIVQWSPRRPQQTNGYVTKREFGDFKTIICGKVDSLDTKIDAMLLLLQR